MFIKVPGFFSIRSSYEDAKKIVVTVAHGIYMNLFLGFKGADDVFADSFCIHVEVIRLGVESSEHPPPCGIFHAVGGQSYFPVQVCQFVFEFIEHSDSLVAVEQACLMV